MLANQSFFQKFLKIDMKKIIPFIFILLVSLSGCMSDEPGLSKEEISGTAASLQSSKYRSIEDAIEIASNATSLLGEGTAVRSRGTGRVVDHLSEIGLIRNSAKSRNAEDDTLIYVVNYANNQGYAMIGASKKAPGLLAVTESGHYDVEEGTDIPALEMWIDDIKESLSTLSDGWDEIDTLGIYNPTDRTYEKAEYDTVWAINRPALVRVAWGQDTKYFNRHTLKYEDCYEGSLYPNKVAGCSNIAISQILTYIRRPYTITLTHDGSHKSIPLDWTKINMYGSLDNEHLTYHPDGIGTETFDVIANLVREIGYRSQSFCKGQSTSTKISQAYSTLKYLGLPHSDAIILVKGGSSQWVQQLTENECVLYVYGGTSADPNNGHSWVCDGLLKFKIRCRYYQGTKTSSGVVNWELVNTDDDYVPEASYLHMNWGWRHLHDGYFISTRCCMPAANTSNYAANNYFITLRR